MHSHLTGKSASGGEAGSATKSGADVKPPDQNLKSKPLPPGLAFIIDAVTRMAQEVRPPIWLDPPPPAPLGQLQPGATTKEGRAHEFI
jgi:hypothetical protein